MMVPSPGQLGPMMRTISESSGEISRRPNPGTGHFNNLDFSISPNCSRSIFHTSFSPEDHSSNMLIEKGPTPDVKRAAGDSGGSNGGSESLSNASSEPQAEDEDGDLEIIFLSIGQLNTTGIDESEDETTSTNSVGQQQQQSTPNNGGSFASVAQRNMHGQVMQQQQQQPFLHVQSPPSNGQGLIRQQQPIAPNGSVSPLGTALGPTAASPQPPTMTTAAVVARCTDGKLITYNPDIYDEADILLSNEKNVNNIRYLKEFRVEQCGNFLQHKCNQHKPFTCFNWHFANQRRRRPIRRRDGTFNYSPDTYCSKYDETTGTCPDGEECPNLHRTAGDTERRYHLRYYKTGMCVYETDRNTGFCMKNGAHCAFAHGQHDLRQPIFDSREQANVEGGEAGDGGNGGGGGGLLNGHGGGGGCGGLYDKDRNAVNEDPRWQDIAFVLANYKTDICKRPPRLCRQGYACPQYHNNKDRRRTPKNFNYRSTPCPSVKQGDEWGDPSNCENDEKCQYCHTRTEQQFHPEIYKSTKCNDIQQSNHCPRGPFCAFAHSESCDEIKAAREFSTDPNADLPPGMITAAHNASGGNGNGNGGGLKNLVNVNCNNTSPVDIARANSLSYSRPSIIQTIPSSLPDHFDSHKFDLAPSAQQQQQLSLLQQHDQLSGNGGGAHGVSSGLGPIARPRSFSTSASTHAANKTGPGWSLLERNNLSMGGKAGGVGNIPSNNSLGSTIFSAASSSTSLFGPMPPDHHHQQQQQQQPQPQQQQPQQLQAASSSASFSTILPPSAAAFYGMQQESMLSHMEDPLGFGDGGGGGGGKMQVTGGGHLVNTSPNVVVGPSQANGLDSAMGGSIDMAGSSLSSVAMLRRSSLLNDPSAPINIPAHRVGPQSMLAADVRSTSAAGFNISPPIAAGRQMAAAAAANSPSMASSFGGVVVGSASFSRQTSCPPGSSVDSQSIFDGSFPTAMNLTGGPQNTPVAPSQLAQMEMGKQEMAIMAMELQRFREESFMQKTQLFNLQNLNQMIQHQFKETLAREKQAEKAREEAIDMLNSTQKELEMVRKSDSQPTFHCPRPSELNGMSLQQLYQLQQQMKQDLQVVEEAIQRASI